MFQGKARTYAWIGLALYTALTLFFLFVGFNRSLAIPETGALRYHLTFDGIPLQFPSGAYWSLWIFNLGNYLAFVPFGLVIPTLIRCRFLPFFLIFLAAITGVELIQMATHLGSFDINDIVINTLGATVGYVAQRLVRRDRTMPGDSLKLLCSGAIVTLAVYSAVSGVNHYLDHGQGEIMALDRLPLEKGNVSWETQLNGFTAAQERIEPAMNQYSRENPKQHEFTLRLDGQYKALAGNIAIPDDALNETSSGRVRVVISADGEEIYSLDMGIVWGENQPLPFRVPLDGMQELAISISNDSATPQTNAVLWDLTLVEANAGQKLAARIHRFFSP